jgi:hypothetical protein
VKLTTTQKAQLDVAKRIADTHREKKRTADARAKLLVEQELAASQYELDRQIRLAVTSGVPKKQMYEGLSMSPNTLYESLVRTEDMAATIAGSEPEHVERFTWAEPIEGNRRVTITLAGADWDELRRDMEPKIRRHGDESSAAYKVIDGALVPRVDFNDRTTPNQYDHPVTAWLLYFGGLAEAEAWIAEQKEGIAA